MINYTVTKIEEGKVGLDNKGEIENAHLTTYHEFTNNFYSKPIQDSIQEIVETVNKKNHYRHIFVSKINGITGVVSRQSRHTICV